MKTQEQKLRHVKEASGECWHLYPYTMNIHYAHCSKCGCLVWSVGTKNESRESIWVNPNPSPDDLNELFRLAEKIINVHNMELDNQSMRNRTVRIVGNINIFTVDSTGHGETIAEALLNALFIATGGKE